MKNLTNLKKLWFLTWPLILNTELCSPLLTEMSDISEDLSLIFSRTVQFKKIQEHPVLK